MKHTTHKMKLKPKPFGMIKSGQKTIELRLLDEKRRLVKVGDVIEFCNLKNGETIIKTVKALRCFDSFEELYNSLPLLKCGYTETDVKTAKHTDMEEYYPKEEQDRYGVVGIELCD